MTGEITLVSTLKECLSIMREELAICSKQYNGLEPKEGMEEAWEQTRRKVQVIKDAIPALETEHVKRAMAEWDKLKDWQKEVMQTGPTALQIDKAQTGAVFYEG